MVDWTELVQVMIHWQTLVKTVTALESANAVVIIFGFQVLKQVFINITVFWYVTCSLVDTYNVSRYIWHKVVNNWAFEKTNHGLVRKSSIIWDITTCIPVKVNRCFGRIYRLRLQGLLLHAGLLVDLLLDPEYGSNIFLLKTGWLLPD